MQCNHALIFLVVSMGFVQGALAGTSTSDQAVDARGDVRGDACGDVRKERKSFSLVPGEGGVGAKDPAPQKYIDPTEATVGLATALKSKVLQDVRKFVDAGARWDQTFEDGKISIHYAAEWGNKNAMDLLLSKIHPTKMDDFVNARTLDKQTPLMIAAERDHLLVVRELYASGARVNAIDQIGETALMKAARNGHVQMVEELLIDGAAVSVISKRGETAMSLAQAGKHEQVVKLLHKVIDKARRTASGTPG